MYVAESKRLTHQGAKKIMATAVDMANEAGIAISCAIVDAGGHDAARTHGWRSFPYRALLHHQGGVRRVEPAPDHGPAGQDLDVSHAIGLALAAGPERWTAMEGGVPVQIDG
jgi:hypothetical protein